MKAYTRIGIVVVGAAFFFGMLTSTAEARRGGRSGWVPNKAWRSVKKYARQKYDPRAKLFKTKVTKSQSRGLRGVKGKAWIVGAALPKRTQPPGMPPRFGFRPYKPVNTYFLVTRGANNRYEVTPLDGMGGYMSKVDAKADNARVGVGVGLYTPGQVGHGIEVSNARRLSVSKGTALAQKRRGNKHTVFVKGDTGGQQWATNAKANLKASIRPDGWCATPINKDIPVHFSQVMFARPMASR